MQDMGNVAHKLKKAAAKRPPLPICAMVLALPTHTPLSAGALILHLTASKADPEHSVIL